MKKEVKLINKIKHLLNRANCPEFLHHFGPKTYKLYQHAFALFIKEECKLSFRRVSKLLRSLGFEVPTYSALCKMRRRIPMQIWAILISNSIGPCYLAAMDSTGLSRPLPSPHYIKRIDKPYPTEIPFKLSMIIDTKSKKILALRFRSKKAHDMKDAKYLLSRVKIKMLVADKGYDAESLHEIAFYKGITTFIPMRKNARKGFFRKKMAKKFRKKTYNRRSIIESIFFSIKRKYGPSITAHKFSAQRAEIYCRALAHNISSLFFTFSTRLISSKTNKSH